MKAYMIPERKLVGVLVPDVVMAGHVGYGFARNNPDLTDQDWVLFYYDDEKELRRCAEGATIIEIGASGRSIADAIKSTCHECGQRRPA